MVSAVLMATMVALTIAVLLVLAPGAIDAGHLIAFIEEDGPLEVAMVVLVVAQLAESIQDHPTWMLTLFPASVTVESKGKIVE
jgi:hypothetical protein